MSGDPANLDGRDTLIVSPPPPSATRRSPRVSVSAAAAFTLLFAACVFWMAYDGGTYGVASQMTVGVVALWLLAAGIVAGVFPVERIGRYAVAGLVVLTALGAWTALSAVWAPNDEVVIRETDRCFLYAAVFALVVLGSRRRRLDLWLDGIALGIGVIGALAVASRCFPTVFGTADLLRAIPLGERRLSYPIGYWNGLSAFVAIGLPLSLRACAHSRLFATRVAVAALAPAGVACMYLTSSRGGVIAAAVALLLLVVLAPCRTALLGAGAVLGVGSVAAVALVTQNDHLVNGPFAGPAAISEGRHVALGLLLICFVTGGALAVATLLLRHLRFQVPRVAERVALVTVLAVAIVGVVAAHPVQKFRAFEASPIKFGTAGYVQNHLLSGNGNGRWQLWGVAVDEFRTHPIGGGGPGTYGPYQTQHGSLHVFVRDAHSLYLQTLAELGLVGLLIVLSLLAVSVVALLAALKSTRSVHGRTAAAAAAACFFAFATASAFDWMWQLPALAVPALAALAILTRLAEPETARMPRRARGVRSLFGVVALAVPLLWLQGAPLLAQLRLDTSQRAAEVDDFGAALTAAAGAKALEPWAAGPYVQLALVEERAGHLASAARSIASATARDPQNWTLWVVRARIATKRDDVPTALASLARVRALNPSLPSLTVQPSRVGR